MWESEELLLLVLHPCAAVLDPDRSSLKAKRFSYLILQEPLVSEVQLHRFIREDNERRRTYRRLRHIQDLHGLVRRNRRSFKVHALDEPVHLARRNALATF